VDDQGFWDHGGRSCPCTLIRVGWSVRPVHLRSLYQGFDAHQVTLLGRPLVPTHSTNATVIILELELEEVWGDDSFHLVKDWTS